MESLDDRTDEAAFQDPPPVPDITVTVDGVAVCEIVPSAHERGMLCV